MDNEDKRKRKENYVHHKKTTNALFISNSISFESLIMHNSGLLI